MGIFTKNNVKLVVLTDADFEFMDKEGITLDEYVDFIFDMKGEN